jgi:hypothetical protein
MAVSKGFNGPRSFGERLDTRPAAASVDPLTVDCPPSPPLLTGPLAAALLKLVANAREGALARRHTDDLSSKAS